MSYYHVPTLTERTPQAGEQRTDTGEWVTPVDGQWTDTDAALCGFLPITETVAPVPGANEIVGSSVALVNGLPVRQWTLRPMTAGEQTYVTAQTNRQTLETKAHNALTANATYLAIATPTNAQVAAQVKALTRQITALIRMTVNALSDTTGT